MTIALTAFAAVAVDTFQLKIWPEMKSPFLKDTSSVNYLLQLQLAPVIF